MDSDHMDVDEDPPSSQLQSQAPYDPAAREQELNDPFPNRPINHGPTLPFHSLFEDLFQPLIDENQKLQPPAVSRKRLGPDHASLNKQERKRAIIERYISRWRRDVGNDFFPALRLIVPEKDRDRAMYGLKEKALGKYLIKMMKIDRNSADAAKILNWKIPVQGTSSGDFAGRCYEVISRRPSRVEVGRMSIEDVNTQLNALSAAAKEKTQLPIMMKFYQQMNAEELKWLIRIILREMKIGCTEKTFFHLWHPDAESLFNISSSLRRVCWELWNSNVRLEGEERGVALMSCFQPQLAKFQERDFNKKIVGWMQPTDDDREFWIEEKLDGERMQMHMISDNQVKGGRSFKFWSRKAKDYTYLYGDGLEDPKGSLTRYLKNAFAEGVENIILDGEMITWDPEQDRQGVFGTLKTAALAEQNNSFAGKIRPLLRVFDILLLNDKPLTRYTLRDRQKALVRSIKPVHRRLEILDHATGTTAEDIVPHLHKAIELAAEGLVVKNPRSSYHTGDRLNDWVKVKPEYMTGYGERLDCLVIAGFYGSGRRGGGLSSFMCGIRADVSRRHQPQKFLSFFRVGGGMKAEDYDTFKHITDGKWHPYDPKNPPSMYLELAGAPKEKPDVWIKPEDSFVVEVKAAQITQTDEFKAGWTLRFPRFVKLRQDKNWETALTEKELMDIRSAKEEEMHKKQLEIDEARSQRRRLASKKKPLKVVGYGAKITAGLPEQNVPTGSVFDGLTFFAITESTQPVKKTKHELEELIKANGGSVVQIDAIKGSEIKVHCIAERSTVKVASLQKKGDTLLIKPIWLLDCVEQAQADAAEGLVETVLPWELERHLYFVPDEDKAIYEDNADKYGDAYFRDTSPTELEEILSEMANAPKLSGSAGSSIRDILESAAVPGWMFIGMKMYLDKSSGGQRNGDPALPASAVSDLDKVESIARFAGANIADDIADSQISHIIPATSSDLASLRKQIAGRDRIPHLVRPAWIEDSWNEKTLLAEERYEI